MPKLDNPEPLESAGTTQKRGRPTRKSEPRRLLDKDESSVYLGASIDTLKRLIQTGELPIVRLPAERERNGRGRPGACRRVLIDVRDLDDLIDRSKERSR